MVVIKCIVVGEKGSGRKSLIMTMVEKKFPVYFPLTGLNPSEYHVVSNIDNCDVDMQFWYCSGGDDYDRLRPLSYPGSHVVLLCFALDSKESFERVRDKYNREIRKHCGDEIPVILVGTKCDLRDTKTDENTEGSKENCEGINDEKETQERGTELIGFREGKELAAKIDAISYIECSALKMQWLDLIVRQASNAGYHYWKNEEMRKKQGHNSYCKII